MITLIGLVPAVLLVVVTAYFFNVVQRSPALVRYGDFAIIHDTYVRLGSMTVTVFPRVWVLALIAFGIGCVVVGLIFLLHIPAATTSSI